MDNMPPLPSSNYELYRHGDRYNEGYLTGFAGYTDDQMHAYARAYAEQRVRPLESECAELRKILSQCTQALGTGAFASSACSLEFLRHIPEEIRKTVEMLRAALAAEQENANG